MFWGQKHIRLKNIVYQLNICFKVTHICYVLRYIIFTISTLVITINMAINHTRSNMRCQIVINSLPYLWFSCYSQCTPSLIVTFHLLSMIDIHNRAYIYIYIYIQCWIQWWIINRIHIIWTGALSSKYFLWYNTQITNSLNLAYLKN